MFLFSNSIYFENIFWFLKNAFKHQSGPWSQIKVLDTCAFNVHFKVQNYSN